MEQNKNESIIKNYSFFKNMCDKPFVECIYVFGSRARQDNVERSDIDLAVDCPQASAKEWQEIISIVENADTLLHIDCVRYDTLKPDNFLKQLIDKDKILLYRKKNGA